MDDLLSEFLIGTSERLVALDGEITRFAASPDHAETQTHLIDLFHTIKGASGFLTLGRLEVIAQAGEDLLGRMQNGTAPATPDAAWAIIGATETIRKIMTAIAASGQEPAGDDGGLLSALRAARADSPASHIAAEPQVRSQSESRTAVEAPTAPAPTEPVAASAPVGASDAPRQALTPVVSSVMVPVDRLESFAGLVGELVQTRNNLNHLMRARDDSELEESLQRLSHITSDLGTGIVATRRQALSQLGEAATDLPGAFDIVTAVTVACGTRRFAIPQRNVLELVWVTPSGSMGTTNDEFRFLRLRDQRLPWIRLSTILGMDMDRTLMRRREIVIMLQAGDDMLGLSVEQVFDAEEIVVRPQPPILKDVGLYSGNTILGDGSLAMVLDPVGILNELKTRQQRLLGERAAAVPAIQN